MTFKALHSYLAYMTVSSVKSGIAGSFKIKYMYSKSFFGSLLISFNKSITGLYIFTYSEYDNFDFLYF